MFSDVPAVYNSVAYHKEWILSTRESIKTFPRYRISVDLWHFQSSSSSGRILSPRDFLSKLRLTSAVLARSMYWYIFSFSLRRSFRVLFIKALAQVPLRSFIFEMNELSKETWETVNADYLFKVRNAFDCHSSREKMNNSSIDYDHGVIPCLPETKWPRFNLANALRTGDMNMVKVF